MTTTRSHLIRARGRTRVLRLLTSARGVAFLAYAVSHRAAMCRICGCTQRRACAGGCWWADAAQTVCSRCLERSMLP